MQNKSGENMLKDMYYLVASFVLFIGIICVYSARNIVKKRFRGRDENVAVSLVKFLGLMCMIAAFLVIYYVR